MIVVLCKDANDVARFYEINPHLVGKTFVKTHINQPTRGYGFVANDYIDAAKVVDEVVIFCHYDVSLVSIGALVDAAKAGNLTGIVGKALDGKYVWGNEITEPTEVSTLDACCLFIPPTKVRFDTKNFDSFHCCAEDFCLSWKKSTGLPIMVYPSQTSHTGTKYSDPKWWAAYRRYKYLLEKKWKGVNFATT